MSRTTTLARLTRARVSAMTTAALAGLALTGPAATLAAQPHNVVLFVPDGLRSQIVDATTAPAMSALRTEGVDFRNSHSLFPTFTTANAAAFATGHEPCDTGDFSNVIYPGFRVTSANATVTPFLESDPVLRQLDDHYGGNYLHEASIIALARERAAPPAYSAAVIGKVGPVGIFDVGALKGGATLIVDDSTGTPGQEIALSSEWQAAFAKYRLSPTAPGRGDNGNAGVYSSEKPGADSRFGTWIPNLAQQQYFLEVAVKVVLPHFKESATPFVLVFWSRDPDGTQHYHGDSFDSLSPGINGPTSLAAIRSADAALATIEQALRSLGLYDTTDIIVAADHGFSTIAKTHVHSASSAPNAPYKDVVAGELPWGFLAIDLFEALRATDPRLKLFDPDDSYRELDWRAGMHPLRGNAIIASDPDDPQIVVASNGGSDLIYLPPEPATWGTPRESAKPRAGAASAQQKLARRIVGVLLGQDYVSGIFVDRERFGKIPGALATEDIGVGGGKALTPRPAVVVNFASVIVTDCARTEPTLCAAEIADTGLQQGQGMHGSFSRADTWNFMAARGPDFRSRFTDPLPASNADIGMTIAHLLGVAPSPHGSAGGRILTEALGTGAAVDPLPAISAETRRSERDPQHRLQTVLNTQIVAGHVYLDAAGFAGRTVGLREN